MNRNRVVLDSSALLAYFLREPGSDMVEHAIANGAYMSTVNMSEVVAKLVRAGVPPEKLTTFVESSGIDIIPFDDRLALTAGLLHSITHPFGLSLGDRACLALAKQLRLPVLTGDQAWIDLNLDLEIVLIQHQPC